MVYIIALISIVLGSFAQYFLKVGMSSVNLQDRILLVLRELINNPYLWGGMLFYGLSMIFWLIVLSKLELSKAYPLVSLGYVFTLFLSYIFLNEDLTFLKVLGIVCIILGVIFISRS